MSVLESELLTMELYTTDELSETDSDEIYGATKSDDGKEYAVDAVQAVSTIGAGDSFNAGLIYGLIKNGIGRDDINNGLKPEHWDSIIATAQMFAAECCKDISNSVSVEFGKEMKL